MSRLHCSKKAHCLPKGDIHICQAAQAVLPNKRDMASHGKITYAEFILFSVTCEMGRTFEALISDHSAAASELRN